MKQVIFAPFRTAITSRLLAVPLPAQQGNIEDFFGDFAAEWIRHDPDLAAGTPYVSGGEQDRFGRELTPLTLAWKRERIQLARKGLPELQKFRGAHPHGPPRLSATAFGRQTENHKPEKTSCS